MENQEASETLKTINDAVAFHNNGQLHEALAIYEQLLAVTPDHIQLLKLKAYALLGLGKIQQATSDLTRFLSMNCCLQEFIEVGEVFSKTDQAQSFLRDFSPLLLKNHLSFELNHLGEKLSESGKNEAAEIIFSRALEISPESSTLKNSYARVLFQNGRYEDSIKEYRESLNTSGIDLNDREIFNGTLITMKDYCKQNPYSTHYKCLKEEQPVQQKQSGVVYSSRYSEKKVPYIGIEPEFYIAEVANASFITGFNPIFDRNNFIIYDLACHRNAWRYDFSMSDPYVKAYNHEKMLLDLPSQNHTKLEIADGILISGLSIQCWGHWINEYAPMFWCLDQSPEYNAVPLLVDGRVLDEPHQLEMLKVLNHVNRPIIRLEYQERYKCRRLIVPSRLVLFPHDMKNGIDADEEDFFISETSIRFLREKFYNPTKSTLPEAKRIFLPRRKASGFRFLKNEEEVTEVFKEFGFIEVELHKMSYQEKLDLLANTEAIAGPVGSGFGNYMFFKDKVKLIFLANHGSLRVRSAFVKADILGQDLTVFECQPESTSSETDNSDHIHSDFIADTVQLRKVLNDLFTQ